MAKRRRVLVGMGALVFGSGVMSVQTGFTNSVSPTGDMRVVVSEELTVEPGAIFRDGTGDPDGTLDPGGNSPGPKGTTLKDQATNTLFGGNDNDGLANLSVSELPAAAVNDTSSNTNGDLSLEVATGIGVDGQIGTGAEGVIQVRNDTTETQDVSIRFGSFGNDASGEGGDVSEQNIVDIFQFRDESGTRISTTDPSTSPQTVGDVASISPGAVEQIYIDFNTSDSANGSGTVESELESAASTSGSPFEGQTDTINLVDTLEIGIEDGNDVA